MSRSLIGLVLCVGLSPATLLAVPIPVMNPSFEDDVLCDGCLVFSSVSGWNTSAGGGLTVEVGRRADESFAGYHVRLEAIQESSSTTWAAGPDMTEARYSFPMVALPSGAWLVAGGVGSNTLFLQTAETLDSGATAWTPAMPMPSAHRGRHHGALLDGGEALVVGEDPHLGSHPHPSTAYRYDAGSEEWSLTTNDPSIDRFLATLTKLPDGRLLLAGGYTGHGTGPTYRTAEIYDPVTDRWSPTGSMAEVRKNHTATLLTRGPNAGKVLVVGGADRSPDNQATVGCELFNPATGSWSSTGSLNESRSAHTATLLPSGGVLVTGGQVNLSSPSRNSAEIYDPDTGTWSPVAAMTTTRVAHTATLLPSGEVLVAGGRVNEFGSTPLASAEIYHPASGEWSAIASLATPRHAHQAVLLADGRVLVAGGLNDDGILASTETFRPAAIFADGFESGDWTMWSLAFP